jgi:hypothetical protein
MHKLHIGSDSEYLRFEIPDGESSEGWLRADVEVSVQCFKGAVSAYFEGYDFREFEKKLRPLYDSLKGIAEFSSREQQVLFSLEGNGRGSISVSGEAWSQACYGSRLEFSFEIDQTFLPGVLAQLEQINAK